MKILAAALAALLAQSAGALDLNGVELGQAVSPATLHDKLGIDVTPGRSPPTGALIASGTYRGTATIAGAGFDTEVRIDAAGRVVEIRGTFTSGIGWSRVLPAALAKWGKPGSDVTLPVIAGTGEQLLDRELIWSFPDHSSAALTRYVSTEEGQLWLKVETITAQQPPKGGAL
jgi:hypothetical protein